MKMGTCADCGKPMHRGTTSLPQGVARCRPCRKADPQPRKRTSPRVPPPYKAMKCADCDSPIWRGSASRPEGEARCHACRRANPSPKSRMAAPLSWEHEAKLLRTESIRGEQVELFRVCVCGIGYTGRAAYCSSRCHARSAYRLRVGIPLDAAPYEVKASA